MGVMIRLPSHLRRASRRRQSGAALLFIVLLVLMGAGIFMVSASQETVRSLQMERSLTSGMQAAKDALIAYAVSQARPGALPCPDTDDDGDAQALVAGQCPSYLGRLPWRTLGLGDVRDAAGERYWYALSDNFRDAVPINSDSHGNRALRSGTAAVTQTNEAVAILFAPGEIVGGQVRDATVAPCTTTGTSIVRRLCAANYLDSAAGVDNAASPGTGPFIAADTSASFNDRVLGVRTPDLIPLVERRVAGDLRRTLVQYREASRHGITAGGCNCYPWADSDLNGSSNVGQNRGRLPLTASPHAWGQEFTVGGVKYVIPLLPAYFQANNWHTVIHYTVGRNALQNFGLLPTLCVSCTAEPLLPPPVLLKGTLSIDKSIGHAVVLIMPGSAGANRPAGWTGNWGDYIDDAGNRDGDDRFLTPAATSVDRDRLVTIPDDLPPASCNTNAQILIRNAPCHTTGTSVKPVCSKAVSNLQFCAMCSGESTVMVTEPCRNTLNPPECQAAVTSLQGCKL